MWAGIPISYMASFLFSNSLTAYGIVSLMFIFLAIVSDHQLCYMAMCECLLYLLYSCLKLFFLCSSLLLMGKALLMYFTISFLSSQRMGMYRTLAVAVCTCTMRLARKPLGRQDNIVVIIILFASSACKQNKPKHPSL